MERLDDDDEGWRRVERLLRDGRVVAVPTDTVYGVAASVARPEAVGALFRLKARERSKPVALLVSGVEQAAEAGELGSAGRLLVEHFWPGALTVVVRRAAGFDVDLGGAGDTVGIRCPDHQRLRSLCAAVGPLATTSANRSGEPTPPGGAEVADALDGTAVVAVLEGGTTRGGVASTVVRVDHDEVVVLRGGPIGEPEVRALLLGRR